jgi:hypothetical protein
MDSVDNLPKYLVLDKNNRGRSEIVNRIYFAHFVKTAGSNLVDTLVNSKDFYRKIGIT